MIGFDYLADRYLLLRWNAEWTTIATLDGRSGFSSIAGNDNDLYLSGSFDEIGGIPCTIPDAYYDMCNRGVIQPVC